MLRDDQGGDEFGLAGDVRLAAGDDGGRATRNGARGTAGMVAVRTRGGAKSGRLLVTRALPPVMALQKRQTPPNRPSQRRHAVCHAIPSAVAAARSTSLGQSQGGLAPNPIAHLVRSRSSSGARSRCRSSQSRTVVAGRSSSAATVRIEGPLILSITACPTVSTASSRRTSAADGRRLVVMPQLVQRRRGTRTRDSCSRCRNHRQYPPHLIRRPPQPPHVSSDMGR